jgi:hypothetical protein
MVGYEVTPDEPVTLEELSLQQQASARVLGLILLLLAGYPFPKSLLEEVAAACGVHLDDGVPAHGGH